MGFLNFNGPKLDIKKESESLRPKHLKEGVKPIVACVGVSPHQSLDEFEIENAKNIDYFIDGDDLISKNFKNAGELTYVISEIDNKDKYSSGFRNCTGIIISGVDKKTNQNISFLSHQDPDYFLANSKHKDQFKTDLCSQMEELKNKCIPNTLDSVIFGGNYLDYSKEHRKNYLKSIEFLTNETKNVLGFTPVIITGPKITGGDDDIFFDNKNKRLYIFRPKVGGKFTEPYNPDYIKQKKKEWLE